MAATVMCITIRFRKKSKKYFRFWRYKCDSVVVKALGYKPEGQGFQIR
jgi:hypothetical protein